MLPPLPIGDGKDPPRCPPLRKFPPGSLENDRGCADADADADAPPCRWPNDGRDVGEGVDLRKFATDPLPSMATGVRPPYPSVDKFDGCLGGSSPNVESDETERAVGARLPSPGLRFEKPRSRPLFVSAPL